MSIVNLPAAPAGSVGTVEGTTGTHVGRLALGLAALVGERLSAVPIPPGHAPPANRTMAISVGLAQEAAARVTHTLTAIADYSARMAAEGAERLAALPAPRTVRDPLRRAKERLSDLVSDAERAGRATIWAGREDAMAFLRGSLDEGIDWAEVRVVPRIVDGLVPHLVSEVVPRLIDGALPAIRERVLPAVIDDLTADPRVRDMVVEQSRGVLGEATENLREGTAHADDRVESIARRLLHRAPAPDA
jgi:hypothetical protein